MNPQKPILIATAWSLSLVALVSAVASQPVGTIAVSPGEPDAAPPLSGRCPAFSWTHVPDAASYELVVYRSADHPEEASSGDETDPVLHRRLPAGASTWTPAGAECLERGATYAWSVRALGTEGGGGFAAPLWFEVPSQPSSEEVEEALRVLRRHLAAGGELPTVAATPVPRTPRAPSAADAERDGTFRRGAPGLSPASFAMRGTNASTTEGSGGLLGHASGASGTTHGVVGLADSPLGTGVDARAGSPTGVALRAANLHASGGPDLELDGDAQGLADTVLTESGLDRPSASPQTFDIANSGGGGIALTVDGVEVGDVTAVTAGTGLVGGGTSGELTLGVAVGGITGIQIANDTVTSADIADGSITDADLGFNSVGSIEIQAGAVGASEIDSSEVQRRILGSCSAGSSIRVVSSTGGVTCEIDSDTDTTCSGAACDGTHFTNLQWANLSGKPSGLDDGDDDTTYQAGPGLALVGNTFSLAGGAATAPMDNVAATLSSGSVRSPSITIGLDGLPLISYVDTVTNDLMVVKCNDASCSGDDETVSTVDSTVTVSWCEIGLAADGLPLIVYGGGSAVRVAKCNDSACSGGDETLSVVASTVNSSSGPVSSLVLGTDGFPVLSYRYDSNLWVAKCNDIACSGGDEALSIVDPANDVGGHSSITLGTDGLPVISYYDAANSALKVAKCNDAACSGGDETLSTADSFGFPQFTSITLGADGLPIISYISEGGLDYLRVVKCDDAACSGSGEIATTLEEVSSGTVNKTSITVGVDGLPLIGYHAGGGEIKIAKCNDQACSGSDEIHVVVGDDAQASRSSLTLGVDGLPIVGYRDSAFRLEVTRCGSSFCVPYWRRR